jgi:hypothetical protein
MLNNGTVENAMEADFIVKQPVGKNLTVTGKAGIGYHDGPDTLATDVRLFLTYAF